VILCDVYHFKVEEAAVQMRASVPRVKHWLARGRAEVRRDESRKHERGAVIAPFALVLDPVTRAAFAALLEAEGRAPVAGGPGGPPRQPPSPPVELPPVWLVPPIDPSHVAAAFGLVVLSIVGVVVAGIFLFWPRGAPTGPARTGLYPLTARIIDGAPAHSRPATIPAQAPTAAPEVPPMAPAALSTQKPPRLATSSRKAAPDPLSNLPDKPDRAPGVYRPRAGP
jgi:hypothetical protein